MNIIEKIRSRTREEYEALARERLTLLRIWLQEHGELALLIGLIAGIVFVEAFQLIALVLMLSVVALLGVWLIALPRSQQRPAPSDNEPKPGTDEPPPARDQMN